MRFLKALFWLIVGMLLALLAYANLDEVVSIELWDHIIVDVKLPALLLITFLIGFLPPFLILRARIWTLKRRLDSQATMYVANTPAGGVRRGPPAAAEPSEDGARVATDSKVWPTG
jgi:lipopolysaccharide assembly protein A